MADHNTTLRAQLIPLSQDTLLLPNSVIAEITPYQPPLDHAENKPAWWLGTVAWRGLEIPLISLEGLLGQPINAILPQSRIAVFNTLQGNPRLPFFAIVIASLPHLLRLDNTQISHSKELREDYLSMQMELATGSAKVPNIDAIESAILTHYSS